MTKRELLEIEPEPERVDAAKRPELAADIRALVRLAIAEREKAHGDPYRASEGPSRLSR